ncbi:Ornithine aminotransferase, mitochondrial [Trichinella patagoniensis]|uniref:Ornithine aminotransferase n=1 Tax=Trichinella patagoniensis TaxID=990121 RepID=A0A0V1AFB2_9BILA|nr:Ornithine aminotransferase, mitochondrial [Trichinella patagoniensis]
MPGCEVFPYDDSGALEQVLNSNGNNVAAFMVEPIQGEAGVRVAKDGGYSRKGGCYLILGVLFDDPIMLNIKPDQQSSTFGTSDAFKMEYLFHQQTHGLPSAIVKAVRRKGLLNAIEINSGYDARELCIRVLENGLLAKITHGNKIRFLIM